MSESHKYKVGDRVRYMVKDIGNIDLHGWIGTVVGIDNDSVAPYTVRFEDDLCTLLTDERFWQPGQPTHRDYFCREENLVLAVEGVDTTEQSIKEPEKKRRKPMKKRTSIYDVPDDVRQRIRTMVEEGMSVGKIAEVMDIEYGKMKNMLARFRKHDPSFPRSTHSWGENHPEDTQPVDHVEDVESAPQDATDYKALYEEARALIEKLEHECAGLQMSLLASETRFEELKADYAKCKEDNENALEFMARQSDELSERRTIIEKMDREIADLNAALEKADKACDEYRQIIEALQKAIDNRQEVLVALKEDKQSMTDMVVGLVRKFVLSGEEVSV